MNHDTKETTRFGEPIWWLGLAPSDWALVAALFVGFSVYNWYFPI